MPAIKKRSKKSRTSSKLSAKLELLSSRVLFPEKVKKMTELLAHTKIPKALKSR